MNNNTQKRHYTCGLLILCLITASTVTTISLGAENTHQSISKTMECTIDFSQPQITKTDQYTTVQLEGVSSVLQNPTQPQLPIVTKTFEFPRGATITAVDVVPSETQTLSLSTKVKPAPVFQQEGDNVEQIDGIYNTEVYSSTDLYPSTWYQSTIGAGINSTGDHVLFLSIEMYPVRYLPAENIVQYIDHMTVHVTYTEPLDIVFIPIPPSIYDLVIITPAEFASDLQPLITHKINHSMNTKLVTLEDIYSNYSGRDQQEKIKYFIKYALEAWNIKYVLLVGDIKKLPIRITQAYPWQGGDQSILSDLYYADIYDANYSFCSWDANHNNTFGEVQYLVGVHGPPTQMQDLDGVDLYPDVNIGRLACSTPEEVQIVVDKIINYEDHTYDQTWFKKIILAGGDTFPLSKGGKLFVYEGEITNVKVAQQLPGFQKIFLWSSKHNLNAFTFNQAINKDAGFVSYAGHGFEMGWGTYRPNAIRNKIGLIQPLYYTPFIKLLRNEYKLPIMFFDACLTAKLDFNISSLYQYYKPMVTLLLAITKMPYNTSQYYPCFAWSFIKKQGGGAIATIGATRSAYTSVDKDGVYAGAGYLDVHFFKAYHEGVTVGEMLTQAQNDYINNVGKDYFTIEEFMLLGDPSLRVGGYP